MLRSILRHLLRRVILQGSRNYIFQLGHMRSGSTVLKHILSSNPQIVGIGETHIRYTSAKDLEELAYRVARSSKRICLKNTYVLDKLLHNHLLCKDVLNCPKLSFIFLIREPIGSINSLLQYPEWFSHGVLSEAFVRARILHYYNDRLLTLLSYAKYLNDKHRALFITHDQLLNRTQDVFRLLENFLELKQPLSESYQLQKTTGVEGVGDPSDKIFQGHIDRNPTAISPIVKEMDISDSQRFFLECSEVLQTCCVSLSHEMAHSLNQG